MSGISCMQSNDLVQLESEFSYFQQVKTCIRNGAGQWIGCIGVAMKKISSPVFTEKRIENFLIAGSVPESKHSSRDSFAYTNDVSLFFHIFTGKHFSCPVKPRHHFVRNTNDIIFFTRF